MFFEDEDSTTSSPKKTFICAVFFAIIGLFVISMGISRYVSIHDLRQKCSKKVTGTCIDTKSKLVFHGKSGSKRVLYPIFRYEIDGQIYEEQGKNSLKSDSSIGKTAQVTLYVNPSDPRTFVYDELIRDRKTTAGHYIKAGIAIIIVSVLIALLCLHTYDPVEKYKLEKHKDDDDSEYHDDDTEYY